MVYLRRATVRRRDSGRSSAAADLNDRSATTWPAAGRHRHCRRKTRRRTPNTRQNRVKFGPPR